jgi:DNA-binding NarL/FixJ family response regulator
MKIRVLIADDHAMVREGLRALIAQQKDMTVVGEAGNGREAIRLARKLLPDVIIMDISMPDLNGIDATAIIKSETPRVRVIALSMHSDRRFVSGMLKSGASGYLLKDCVFQELTAAIRAAADNEHYLSPKIAGTVVEAYLRRSGAPPSSTTAPLTLKEREVLQMIAEGRSTREIAGVLNLSVKTVEARRRNIMEKLQLSTLAALIKYALREGMTSLDP